MQSGVLWVQEGGRHQSSPGTEHKSEAGGDNKDVSGTTGCGSPAAVQWHICLDYSHFRGQVVFVFLHLRFVLKDKGGCRSSCR